MKKRNSLKAALALSTAMAGLTSLANAADFSVAPGDLKAALDAYAQQAGIALAYREDAVAGVRSRGAAGDLSADAALSRILSGTGFVARRHASGAVSIVRDDRSSDAAPAANLSLTLAQATPARAAVETVTVTSSKLGGADVQSIPIAITALSQEQLTATQTAGGPDLVKQVPNLTFTKTNFSGYSIQIRGIGTQAISVTTDPAVAVALNDMPFIRNHFFEQEFFDLSQAEVLRGPQGTLYGRNATAGVVNLITAKPTDQFEAMASGDIGNYKNRRFEGMINLPLVDDRLDLRVAGEWTKRDGYSVNQLTGNPIDGRNLWSSRVSLAWKPIEKVQTWLVWEHFQEDDDRLRTSKQLCKTDPTPDGVLGQPVGSVSAGVSALSPLVYLGQGCQPVGLYDKGNPANRDYGAFGVPNGVTLPYFAPLGFQGVPLIGLGTGVFNPYANTAQSTNLRVIESTIDPAYKAKNDTIELNVDYQVTPELTLTSQTGYSSDFLWSTQDYNRFNTQRGIFTADGRLNSTSPVDPNNGVCAATATSGSCEGKAIFDACEVGALNFYCSPVGIYCDPQLGCSDRLVAQDLNNERSWQLNQEIRLASNFSGPFNFSIGGNYLHYETYENYYVFINTLTLASYTWLHYGMRQNDPWVPGASDNSNCIIGGHAIANPSNPSNLDAYGASQCMYIDPNPISSLNNQGHNYFLSQNPYVLNSYAGFGEAYYNVTPDLKFTGGLRWTDDQKHFVNIPSQLLVFGYGYPITGIVNQEWQKFTGRFAANWTPKFDFTDQTLMYGSFAHGYKAGGANPPGATLLNYGTSGIINPIHPLTFEPEFINAYELGTKNTLLDGALTLNGSAFFYDYTGYQISRIVDRTAINDNFDATVKGVEVEASYEPLPGLRFRFAGGYENSRIKDGESSVDLMDRADKANHPGWMVVKPFVTQASNCVIPDYVVAGILYATANRQNPNGLFPDDGGMSGICSNAYLHHFDPLTFNSYVPNPTQFAGPAPMMPGYPGFDPLAGTSGHPYTGQNTFNGVDYGPAPNNGEGFAKDLSGHELPNAPPFTISMSGDYTTPLTPEWAGTLHVDYYWQDYSWARVFNDDPYDRLRGYTNVNLALIFTNQAGWQVMGYVKNVFNVTDITGTFLNSDDSGLTTNVFLTDPRLFGVRVTKNW